MATATAAVPTGAGAENQPPSMYPAWRENLNIHLICPDCKQNPPDLVEDSADTICGNCGRVLAERLVSYESEWRTFNSDEKGGEDPNRVGEVENDLLFGNSGTTIGGGGANLSKETRKLKKAQAMQNEDKNNRALQNAYAILDGWADGEHFTRTVKEQAKSFYKQVFEAGVFRGKHQNAILAGCLFIACRANRHPRSFAEIVNLTKIPKKEIGRTYKQLEKFFNLRSKERIEQMEAEGGIVNHESLQYKHTTSSKPSELVPRYCGMLGFPFRVQVIALELCSEASHMPTLAGKSPLSVTAACIHFASHLLGKGKPITEVTEVTNVSDATMKGAYKILLGEKERLVKPEWLGEQPTTVRDKGKPTVGKLSNLPTS
ncbi:transcription initiation factor IIB [Knufia obscura]|uniref:Transcription initiation factor IIB n=2 Tax=Knufia TaxID=430999 RepID=A0AAN8ENA3_9EURO|nr:transcription initiation factor IIB [Knufia obscura]KAK5955208.1 transcription initiation factor IIB [Knufia fluminis]